MAMILTDGVDTFTYDGGLGLDDSLILEQATARTVAGNLRTVVAGQRYTETLQLRLKAADKESLFALLNKRNAQFIYTPKVLPGYISSSAFPMLVTVDPPVKKGHAGGDGKTYYYELKITSVGYV